LVVVSNNAQRLMPTAGCGLRHNLRQCSTTSPATAGLAAAIAGTAAI
jgi:hypothetical protein